MCIWQHCGHPLHTWWHPTRVHRASLATGAPLFPPAHTLTSCPPLSVADQPQRSQASAAPIHLAQQSTPCPPPPNPGLAAYAQSDASAPVRSCFTTALIPTTHVSFSWLPPGPGDNDLRRITGDRLAVRQGGAARRDAFRRTALLPALQALVELPEWGSWKASLRGCYPFPQVG